MTTVIWVAVAVLVLSEVTREWRAQVQRRRVLTCRLDAEREALRAERRVERLLAQEFAKVFAKATGQPIYGRDTVGAQYQNADEALARLGIRVDDPPAHRREW